MNFLDSPIKTDNLILEKRAIFQASLKLIREGKFYATSMSEIAFQARISGTMIFYVFENREKLLAELAEKILIHISRIIEDESKKSLSFKETFFSIWLGLYQFYCKYPDVISFIEQIENLEIFPVAGRASHPANAKPLIDLFKNQQALKADMPSAETLALILHANVLLAAKMRTKTPEELLSLLFDGIYNRISRQ